MMRNQRASAVAPMIPAIAPSRIRLCRSAIVVPPFDEIPAPFAGMCHAAGLMPSAPDARLDKWRLEMHYDVMTTITRGTSMLALAALTAACSGGDSGDRPRRVARGDCPVPGSALVAMAAEEYVERLKPTPRRFLLAVGGDTALPEPAKQVMQDKGPTYLYPADSAARQQIKERLADAGQWPALMVTYHGVQ